VVKYTDCGEYYDGLGYALDFSESRGFVRKRNQPMAQSVAAGARFASYLPHAMPTNHHEVRLPRRTYTVLVLVSRVLPMQRAPTA
jgi:hypothetical protein